MRVSGLNNYNNVPSMRAYKYKPDRTPFYINPIKQQVDHLFERSVLASRRRTDKLSPDLIPYLNEISIKSDNVDTYAYDITKNDGQGKYLFFLHGLGQNISSLQGFYQVILNNTGYSIFAPEYRGFGKNAPAEISNKTFLEDTQTALDYLINEKQVEPKDICIVGHSFGGFIASQLAKNNPDIGRMILVASVDNLESEIMRSSAMKHVSPWAFNILKHIKLLRVYLKNLFNTKAQLQKSAVPVDIIHSLNDRVVNYQAAEYLSTSCQNLRSIKRATDT